METIIRTNANTKNKEILELEKKRLILYNAKKEILVYRYSNEFYFPFTNISKKETFEETLQEKMGIELLKDNIEELITVIDYEKIFIKERRKLKEAYKKLVNEYYSYYMEFDDDKLSRMIDYSIRKSKYEYLDLISIDELIEWGISNCYKLVPPLKKLKRKLNYEEY